MQVEPVEIGQAAIWHFEDDDIRLVAVWTEKKKGRGEDAPPTAVYQRNSRRGMLAVYDGVGGAGARPVGRIPEPDGREVSGAFLASRLAHFALEDWFFRTETTRPVTDAGTLDQDIEAGMQQTGVLPNLKITGTMVRHLPTTVAAIEYQVERDHLNVVARWAGDSRAYLLHERSGLGAISRDDTQDSDALTLLINDQPMNNMISADRPVQITSYLLSKITLPVILICATDGFFNYVPTPPHFEYLLLDTMLKAPDLGSWALSLAQRVQEYSGDDASLAAVSFGYPTFEAMQLAFRPRRAHLSNSFRQQRIDKIDPERDRDLFVAARKSCWEDYRYGYERFIRARGGKQ